MNYRVLLVATILLALGLTAYGQGVPQGVNYQAVARMQMVLS